MDYGSKNKIMILFKTNRTRNYSKPNTCQKCVCKSKETKKNKSKNNKKAISLK